MADEIPFRGMLEVDAIVILTAIALHVGMKLERERERDGGRMAIFHGM